MASAEALATIAAFWRSRVIPPETSWKELRELNHAALVRLDSLGLLQRRSSTRPERIVDDWQFPMYSLDLTLTRIDIESLREPQRLWAPDW
jgi:hypothetical protein